MNVQYVHFTAAATDPVEGLNVHGVRLVTVADGGGADEAFVSCLHFEPGGWINNPPVVRDSALFVVHGELTFVGVPGGLRLTLSCGTGLVIAADEHYRLESEPGAIALAVEAERLEATQAGVSTPERVMRAIWPGESVARRRRPLRSLLLKMCLRLRWGWALRTFFWRPPPRRLVRADSAGWAAVVSGNPSLDRKLSGRRRDGPSG